MSEYLPLNSEEEEEFRRLVTLVVRECAPLKEASLRMTETNLYFLRKVIARVPPEKLYSTIFHIIDGDFVAASTRLPQTDGKLILPEPIASRSKGVSLFRFFTRVELCSRILPTRLRLDVFEPAYNDEKRAFLEDRRRYKTKGQRRWLATTFSAHVLILGIQSILAALNDKSKRLLISWMPKFVRRYWG